MKKNNLKYILFILFLTWMIFALVKTFHSTYSPIILVLFYLEGFIALFAAFSANSKKLLIQLIILGYSVGNILLTIFDQMGFYDLIILALYLVVFLNSALIVIEDLKEKQKGIGAENRT